MSSELLLKVKTSVNKASSWTSAHSGVAPHRTASSSASTDLPVFVVCTLRICTNRNNSALFGRSLLRGIRGVALVCSHEKWCKELWEEFNTPAVWVVYFGQINIKKKLQKLLCTAPSLWTLQRCRVRSGWMIWQALQFEGWRLKAFFPYVQKKNRSLKRSLCTFILSHKMFCICGYCCCRFCVSSRK